MLTMLGWSSCAASRASLRNISTNCLSRATCGRIRFRQTSFSKPAAPACRARYTSAIPPEAISFTSLYLPSGVVIQVLRCRNCAEARERAMVPQSNNFEQFAISKGAPGGVGARLFRRRRLHRGPRGAEALRQSVQALGLLLCFESVNALAGAD